ncbi:hypothetical protein VW35_19435 [Devosia soli]|uniref:Polysaccharide biosynthesis protein C-terminal domain-containing protein n=1 Tax=Devosia soli TaxID=361041 RepID=A0A0F5L0G7_9HYPH|nr:hypothetical protein [Devosia soli]KKB75921.1 hypothetical protein VW35_19435 [Devosia soli]
MRRGGHLYGAMLAALPAAALFLAQTWLVAAGKADAILPLARYGGLLALFFFAFDGNSGLAPGLIRLRHSEAAIRTAFLAYRLSVLGLLASLLPVAWLWDPAGTAAMLPFCAAALLLRLPFLDGDLDQRRLQSASMLLQNLWMLPLAASAVLWGTIDAVIAGQCALWSSLIYAAVHLRFRRRSRLTSLSAARDSLREICSLMAANGIGQIYGRMVLFVLGSSFAGPTAALIVYGKQLFNASGIVVAYLRRAELQRGTDRSMRLSLWGQGIIALGGSMLLALMAFRLGLSPLPLLAIIAWQIGEKLSSTAVYSFQVVDRHDLGLAGLGAVVVLGSAGLILATGTDQPLIFVGSETCAFALVLSLWMLAHRRRSVLGAAP